MSHKTPTPTPPPDGEGLLSAPPSPGGKGAGGLGQGPRRWGLRRAAIVGLLAGAGAGAAVAVWFLVFREPEPRNDVERFQGDWKFSTPSRPDITFVRVSGDRWQYISNGTEARAYRMTLNETTDPKQVDLEQLDTQGLSGSMPKLHGIYAFDNNRTVRVRLGPATEPRPTVLDDPDEVRVLTKVKLDKTPSPGAN
jgi:uncharacterized protein (TIGR03067 family)